MNKISIIVPCYGRAKQVKKTVGLLLNSKGAGVDYQMEVIVSDCTEDDSVEKVARSFKGVKYTRPEKPGIAANKNQGAKVAESPIIGFLDSDMEVEKDTVSLCLEKLKEDGRVAALTTEIVWRGNEKEGSLDRPREEDRLLKYEGTVFTEFIYSRFKLTYKEIFEKVGGYDEKVFNMRGEGSDLSTRYWRAGFPLAYNRKAKVHHHEMDEGVGATAKHPEWGVAKDYLLLGYKYGNYDDNYGDYFAKTIGINMQAYDPEKSHFRVLQGVAKNYELVSKSKKILDEQKKKMSPEHDFRFMEVFSDKEKLRRCIDEAEKKIAPIRKKVFKQ